jgi:hypothetical protein
VESEGNLPLTTHLRHGVNPATPFSGPVSGLALDFFDVENLLFSFSACL